VPNKSNDVESVRLDLNQMEELLPKVWARVYDTSLTYKFDVNYKPFLDRDGSVFQEAGKDPASQYGFIDQKGKRLVLNGVLLSKEDYPTEWMGLSLAQLIPMTYMNESHGVYTSLLDKNEKLSGVMKRFEMDIMEELSGQNNSTKSDGDVSFDYNKILNSTTINIYPENVDVLEVSEKQIHDAIYKLEDEVISDLFWLKEDEKTGKILETERIPECREALIAYNTGFRLASRFKHDTETWLKNPKKEELHPSSQLPNPKHVYLAFVNAAIKEGTIDEGITAIEKGLSKNIHAAFRAGDLATLTAVPMQRIEGAMNSLIVDISNTRQRDIVLDHLEALREASDFLSFWPLSGEINLFMEGKDGKHGFSGKMRTDIIDSGDIEGVSKIIAYANKECMGNPEKVRRYYYARI
jgi:hypothetical protein